MNKEKYLAQRNTLLEEGQALINAGDFKGFNEKKAEIEKLDNDFENAAREQANLNALRDNVKVADIQNKGVGTVVGTVVESTTNQTSDDLLNSVEYRQAFMNHVVRGVAIPAEFTNVDSNTKTGDVGVLIPTTVLEKIIEKLESTGMILSSVTRTSYKGGVSIPVSSVKPVAKWVTEGSGSDKQKKDIKGSITFAYHKLRCAVSVSFETDLMALSIFETTLINNITEAMTKALEQAIISGTGEGQPKGILTEEVNEGQEIKASTLSYDTLVNAEAALPLEYEDGAVHCMTKKTFMAYIGLKDSNGQPIARINYGIGGKPERILLGRPVILCNYLKSFDTAETGEVFHFLFNFKDYVLNTNYNMGLKKYEDNDTDDMVTKAIMIADGKVVIKDSLVTIKK